MPPANLDAAGKALTNFQSAATPAARNAALRPLRQALQAIMSFFQSAANAVVIVESGGFKVKQIAINQKHSFELSNGVNSGTIDLDAEGAGQHACHDWMYSADGKSFTHMDGLTPGQYACFTHEVVTKDGGQGVSQIESIMVK